MSKNKNKATVSERAGKVRSEADIAREINNRPGNKRVKVLMPSMKTRLMALPEYEAWLARRQP